MGVDGQQGHHAAQQHRKQVERDGAQNDGARADKGNAPPKTLPHRALGRPRCGGIGHHHPQQQRHTQHKTGAAHGIGQLPATQGIQHAAEQRPANAGRAHEHAVGRNRLRELGARHDLRQQALHGRA
ncbi:hypothetical protein D3C71_1657680 [compost metagenome]